MEVIRATWKNGRIVPDGPVDWPEGCRLAVEPEVAGARHIAVREEDQSDSPEPVSDWLAWDDSLEPHEFTPQEEADLTEWRQNVKEYAIANMHKGIESLSDKMTSGESQWLPMRIHPPL